ncbi:MAG: SUMF1/EgtB/PvdO family nonheme iron enzyme [Verrucomicrobiales bacterium]
MISQEELLSTIDRVDAQMTALVDDLSDDQLHPPYDPGINPPIWELGHAAFFYEFFLLRRLYGTEPLMPDYDSVWDSFDIPHRERWNPGVVPEKEETFSYYRRVVDETRDHLARSASLSDEESYLGQYVVAHQCMHLESLIWCRQTLGYPPPPFLGEKAEEPVADEGSLGDVEIPGGTYFIGVPKREQEAKSSNFSFDNERPGFEMTLPGFRISPTLVSQGEYLAFVEDGGYRHPDHWSFGGRYWLRECGRTTPAYWQKRDGEWAVRRFDSLDPLDRRAPVLHLSFWEAEAFCRWAGRRLPSEFEWEVAARGPRSQKFPWGDRFEEGKADLDCRRLGTAPVAAFPEGDSSFGCRQMIGTAWEWTSSQYLPYDGFCVDMYAYMSTLQFGDHKTTRGGSGATSAFLIRNTYRQAYHPDRHDVFAGFRTCAADA